MSLARYPNLKPQKGLVFEAYMSRADIGSGVRLFIVVQVGRKFIHLFYAPKLMSIKLTHSAWRDLYMQPATIFSEAKFKAALRSRMVAYDRFNGKYNHTVTALALALRLTCGHDWFSAQGWKPGNAPIAAKQAKRG